LRITRHPPRLCVLCVRIFGEELSRRHGENRVHGGLRKGNEERKEKTEYISIFLLLFPPCAPSRRVSVRGFVKKSSHGGTEETEFTENEEREKRKGKKEKVKEARRRRVVYKLRAILRVLRG